VENIFLNNSFFDKMRTKLADIWNTRKI